MPDERRVSGDVRVEQRHQLGDVTTGTRGDEPFGDGAAAELALGGQTDVVVPVRMERRARLAS